MRLLLVSICLFTFCVSFAADAPFPDNKANHWAYANMAQIKKDRLWYRVNDYIPGRPIPTRRDMATKTLYLAIDSENLIRSLKATTAMVSLPAADPATQKWARGYAASFPKKKILYQNYLRGVTRLWNYFRPEIKVVAKDLKLDPKEIGNQLIKEKKTLDGIHLNSKIAFVGTSPSTLQ